MRRTVAWVLVLVTTLGYLSVACGVSSRPAAAPRPAGVRVASFDFPESRLLAELYATALERRGYVVHRLFALGSREVVEPALEQHLVDMVPEYLGTSLDFLSGGRRRATADAEDNAAQLRRWFAAQGVRVLRHAEARDSNGFVVASAFARQHGLHRISDLRRLSSTLVLGGPPECAERPLCLIGLREVYGLRFREFRPLPSGPVIAEALRTGEIAVGMLDTTSGQLADPALRLLVDDRRLQPAENVVPVVNRAVARRLGARFVRTLNDVSARLDTASLVAMNRAVDVADRPAHDVVSEWLRAEGLW